MFSEAFGYSCHHCVHFFLKGGASLGPQFGRWYRLMIKHVGSKQPTRVTSCNLKWDGVRTLNFVAVSDRVGTLGSQYLQPAVLWDRALKLVASDVNFNSLCQSWAELWDTHPVGAGVRENWLSVEKKPTHLMWEVLWVKSAPAAAEDGVKIREVQLAAWPAVYSPQVLVFIQGRIFFFFNHN